MSFVYANFDNLYKDVLRQLKVPKYSFLYLDLNPDDYVPFYASMKELDRFNDFEGNLVLPNGVKVYINNYIPKGKYIAYTRIVTAGSEFDRSAAYLNISIDGDLEGLKDE